MNIKILVVGAVLATVFGAWIIPKTRVAGDSPLSSKESIELGLSVPQTWSDRFNGLGTDSLSTLWSWPADVAYTAGSKLGLPLWILQRVLGVFLALGFGIWGMKKLSNWWGVLVYLTTTYFLLLIDGGQVSLAIVYGLLPLCFYLFRQALLEAKVKNILRFSAGAWLLSVFDIRSIYFLLILILLNFIYGLFANHKSLFLNHVKIGLVTGIVLATLHTYWLVPAIMIRPPQLPAGYSGSGQLTFLNFANWKHAVLLQQPHWPKNIFGQVSRPKKELLVFPLLVLASLVWIKKEKTIGFWLVVAILGVLLSKGSGWPFGGIYSWSFANIPGFLVFRDSTKFYFLSSLAFAVLIGIVLSKLEQKWKWIGVLFAIYVLFVTRPVWLGQMTGMFSQPRFEKDYSAMNSYLDKDKDMGRILWVPSRSPSGSIWPQHLPIDTLHLISNRVFAGGIVGSYETMNWLRDATYSGQLLSIAGIKYVIYPPLDPLRSEMKPDQIAYHQLFQSQLENTAWAKKTQSFGQVKIIETKNHQDLFWVPAKTWFVVGSDEILTTGIDLSQEVLIFAEKDSGILAQIDRLPTARIKLYRKNLIDAAATLLPESNLIFPARQLKNDPDSFGWWKRDSLDFLWWRDFLQTKYNLDNQDFDYKGGWAVGEGERKFSILNSKLSTGKILLARVMKSPRGGAVKFFQNGKLIGQADTLTSDLGKKNIVLAGKPNEYDRAEFGWSEIGEIGNGEIEIRAAGEINAVNVLGVVDTNKWLELKSQANEMISQKPKKTEPATVSYQKLSPAHYKVKLDGNGPQVLFFSQTFDPLWTTNSQGSVEAYGFLNAFPIAGPGEYDIYFTPQKYVWMQWIWDKLMAWR